MKVIEERSKVYGDFKDIAEISQKLKKIMKNVYDNANPVVCEGLDMILHKLARIGSTTEGWKNIDNVRDIAGYAQLIVDYLENQSEEAIDSEVYYKIKKNGIWNEPKRNL